MIFCAIGWWAFVKPVHYEHKHLKFKSRERGSWATTVSKGYY